MGLVVQMTGALLVLGAFALLQARRLGPKSVTYLLMNLAGAGLLAANAGVNEQWGFVLLNTVWFAVSLVSLVRRGAAPA
ncbi:MAG: CBU_0592 family membrane protein [Actinomycetes bacterium]